VPLCPCPVSGFCVLPCFELWCQFPIPGPSNSLISGPSICLFFSGATRASFAAYFEYRPSLPRITKSAPRALSRPPAKSTFPTSSALAFVPFVNGLCLRSPSCPSAGFCPPCPAEGAKQRPIQVRPEFLSRQPQPHPPLSLSFLLRLPP